jgi:hypothetical protein
MAEIKIPAKRQPDIVVTDSPEVVAEKIRLAKKMNQRPPGEPSLFEELMEDRRREREHELKKHGF